LFEHLGTVRQFSNRKGYGFLARSDGGPDVFVHYSVIQTETHKSLKKGEAVRFRIVQDLRGPRADSVVALRKSICARHSDSRNSSQTLVSVIDHPERLSEN
jgi:CspA family cold shock protein